MKKQTSRNIRLGAFVLAGFGFLMLMLFIVGKDTNMFSNNITLKAHFHNVNGLMPGNNVRFSGIQVGTVRSVTILNDTTVEVVMVVEQDVQQFIKKNALVNIGSEGLMGNKILNITPVSGQAATVEDGDMLGIVKNPDTDEMLKILYQTNNTVAAIAASVKFTVDQVNNSATLWSLLNDPSVSDNVKSSLRNIRTGTDELNVLMATLHTAADSIQYGSGLTGTLISDTALTGDLIRTATDIRTMATDAGTSVEELNAVLAEINAALKSQDGAFHAVLQDTALVGKLNRSITNIEAGSAAFNENMEALKTSFLFRRYFKQKE